MIPLISILLLFVNSGHEITWKDYKAKPPKDTLSTIARTYTGMELTTTDDGNGNISFSVKPIFYSNLSWTRTKDPGVLKHELRHIAINRINASRCQIQLLSCHRPEEAQQILDFWIKETDRLNEEFNKQSPNFVVK